MAPPFWFVIWGRLEYLPSLARHCERSEAIQKAAR